MPQKETFMELDTAQKIIGCLKEPYRTLANTALYGGLGRKEVLSLNRMWPTIMNQLKDARDPVRIDFTKRKSNPHPYFTFLPAKVLKPHLGKEVPFCIYTKHSKVKKQLRPVNESDLHVAWVFAKKRAGVTGKQTFHMLRDLVITSFYRIGADTTTAQFLTGHGVDSNHYLQIMKAPERAENRMQPMARTGRPRIHRTDQNSRMMIANKAHTIRMAPTIPIMAFCLSVRRKGKKLK
ncbi:MAG: tyrosine-type recombinase/integrase [archaeon]